MKSHLSFIWIGLALAPGAITAEFAVRAPKCDVDRASSILVSLSTGASFCSSYIHATAESTKTKTVTVTVSGACSTDTKTKTAHATLTSTIYGKTTTLPTITLTEYSSSVLIPSGPAPTIDKRSPATVTPANQPATPTALSTCVSQTISSACSCLLTPTNTKITVTSTKTKKCTDPSTTTVTTTVTDRTVTTKIPYLVSPNPVVITTTGVLTTTVPAACASNPYEPNGNGPGNEVFPQSYPIFAQTGVECCVACFAKENCVASAVIYADDERTIVAECQFLVHTEGTQTGGSKICPLGIQDYPFGSPLVGGNVYPGPCGR